GSGAMVFSSARFWTPAFDVVPPGSLFEYMDRLGVPVPVYAQCAGQGEKCPGWGAGGRYCLAVGPVGLYPFSDRCFPLQRDLRYHGAAARFHELDFNQLGDCSVRDGDRVVFSGREVFPASAGDEKRGGGSRETACFIRTPCD